MRPSTDAVSTNAWLTALRRRVPPLALAPTDLLRGRRTLPYPERDALA